MYDVDQQLLAAECGGLLVLAQHFVIAVWEHITSASHV